MNGTTIPAPSDYQVGVMDISKAERNAKGEMIIERIATKQKIELQWKVMNREVYSSLLNLISSTFFEVEYVDPLKDIAVKKTMYVGDRTAGALNFWNGSIKYRDVKMNFIEK